MLGSISTKTCTANPLNINIILSLSSSRYVWINAFGTSNVIIFVSSFASITPVRKNDYITAVGLADSSLLIYFL